MTATSTGTANGWEGSVVVQVDNGNGSYVNGVKVTGTWNTPAGTVVSSCNTAGGSAGNIFNPPTPSTCTVTDGYTTDALQYNTGSATFTVTAVTGLALTGYTNTTVGSPSTSIYAPAGTMYTNDASLNPATSGTASGWMATVTVTVNASGDATAGGVTVTGTWSNTAGVVVSSCQTSGSGATATCPVSDGGGDALSYQAGPITFTVTSLAKSGVTDTTTYIAPIPQFGYPGQPYVQVNAPTPMHESLMAGSATGAAGGWQASVTIHVESFGQPVNQVAVTGKWSTAGVTSFENQCVTDVGPGSGNGYCTVFDGQTDQLSYAANTSDTFTLQSLALTGYADTTGETSNSPSVTVSAPPSTMVVSQMTGSSSGVKTGWEATVTIAVTTTGQANGAGVHVTGTWNRPSNPASSYTTSCTTALVGATYECQVFDGETNNLAYNTAPSATFTVNSATAPTPGLVEAGATDATVGTPAATATAPVPLTIALTGSRTGRVGAWTAGMTITASSGFGQDVNGITVTGTWTPNVATSGNSCTTTGTDIFGDPLGTCTVNDGATGHLTGASAAFTVAATGVSGIPAGYYDNTTYPLTLTENQP